MWPLLALTGAKMLTDADAAERKRKVDEAGVRYGFATGNTKLPFEDPDLAGTAIKGYAGWQGMDQAERESGFKDRLAESQIDLNRAKADRVRRGAGSMMNLWDMPEQSPYAAPAQQPGGYDWYTRKNPWGGF